MYIFLTLSTCHDLKAGQVVAGFSSSAESISTSHFKDTIPTCGTLATLNTLNIRMEIRQQNFSKLVQICQNFVPQKFCIVCYVMKPYVI